jgi:hypothetical protein
MIGAPRKLFNSLVPEGGLEPPRGYPHRILSPARLPFHHSGTRVKSITYNAFGFKNARPVFRRSGNWDRGRFRNRGLPETQETAGMRETSS